MSDQSSVGTEHLKHWQECEIPGCFNGVPKAKGICDDHAAGGES
jgi:hypothetical protein